jgi:hypothetical protein
MSVRVYTAVRSECTNVGSGSSGRCRDPGQQLEGLYTPDSSRLWGALRHVGQPHQRRCHARGRREAAAFTLTAGITGSSNTLRSPWSTFQGPRQDPSTGRTSSSVAQGTETRHPDVDKLRERAYVKLKQHSPFIAPIRSARGGRVQYRRWMWSEMKSCRKRSDSKARFV